MRTLRSRYTWIWSSSTSSSTTIKHNKLPQTNLLGRASCLPNVTFPTIVFHFPKCVTRKSIKINSAQFVRTPINRLRPNLPPTAGVKRPFVIQLCWQWQSGLTECCWIILPKPLGSKISRDGRSTVPKIARPRTLLLSLQRYFWTSVERLVFVESGRSQALITGGRPHFSRLEIANQSPGLRLLSRGLDSVTRSAQSRLKVR